MSRRERFIHLHCDFAGCAERSFTTATSQREEAEVRRRYRDHPYRCFRHRQPDEVLSVDSPEKTAVLTATSKTHGTYWGDGSGLVSGPGFKAIASDFPPGTRLVVTARIELSEES